MAIFKPIWPTTTPAPASPTTPDADPFWSQPPPSTAPGQSFAPVPSGKDPAKWKQIVGMLAAAQSTDDPEYWYGVMDRDPNAFGSAIEYWRDRINRGDGAAAVRNGSVARVNDSPRVDDSQYSNFGAPPSPYASVPMTAAPPPTYVTPPLPDALKTPWQLPTSVTEENDPGYAFRLGEGNRALQFGAAAKGSLLSGGTQKALAKYSQDYASNEFQNVVDRSLGQRNQQIGEYNQLVGNQNLQYKNQYDAYSNENARTLQDWLQNYLVTHNKSLDWWANQNAAANRGLTATLGSRPS